MAKRVSLNVAKILLPFLGIWTVLTAGFDIGIAFNLYRQLQAVNFPTTSGVITASGVIRSTSTDSDGHNTNHYAAEVSFRYSVDKQSYESDTWRYGAWATSDRDDARRVVKRYPVGKQVEVFYNPDNPASAVLVTGIAGIDLFLIMFMLPFNAVMLGGWFALLRMRWQRSHGPGGLKVRSTYDGVVAYLPRFSAFVAALAVAGTAGFVGIFLVGFNHGFSPPLPLMQKVLSGIGLLAGAMFVLKLLDNLLHRRVLRINTQRHTLSLPGVHQPISFDQITSIHMQAYHAGKPYHGPSGFYIFHPIVAYTDQRGDALTAKLPALATADKAEQLAYWLREQVGMIEVTSDTTG